MRLAPLAGLAIVAVAGAPSGARAAPHFGSAAAIGAAPSFLVQISHHHHHRHHWRYWSRRGEPDDESAPEAAGTSVVPQQSAAPSSGEDSGKPTIRWVDPERRGR